MQETAVEVGFFRLLFGTQPGYICIASESAIKGDFDQRFFEWPIDEDILYEHIIRERPKKNVWFCVNLLSRTVRRKEYCLETDLVWSDLDQAAPEDIDPPPSIVIESSPGRYQAIWRVDRQLDSYVAEDYSKRLAYHYVENGADPSGWDLTQLLRVPATINMKYAERPETRLLHYSEATLPVAFFEALPEVAGEKEIRISDAPNLSELPNLETVIRKHLIPLQNANFLERYERTPDPEDDWSAILWGIIKTASECGLSPEEVYVLATHSKFNKYDRDKRPAKYLWRDVMKASMEVASYRAMLSTGMLEMPELIEGQKYDDLPSSFVDEYRTWGKVATDAPAQYHDLSAFILLSSLLAGNIRVDTSYGAVRPNLWGLVLGDSTLTRKTTAMRMATEIISFVDKDILVASEGSIEGILGELGARPGRTSMFFRDEVTGFFDASRKQDYRAGMLEVMTQLYDVPHFFTRRLKKETISVREPVFIFFGGGIKDKLLSVMDDSYIYSGFLPRFLIVSGETDLTSLRRTGPPTRETGEQKQAIYTKLHDLYRTYAVSQEVQILGTEGNPEVQIEAILTNEAWELYGDIEFRLVEIAAKSGHSGVALPTFDRLTGSMLKMAVLLAAAEREPEQNMLQVTVTDLLRAARYIQHWGNYSIELFSNVGRTVMMRVLEKVLVVIQKNPGIARGQVMRLTNLSKREMTEIEETLQERGQILVGKRHGGKVYTAI